MRTTVLFLLLSLTMGRLLSQKADNSSFYKQSLQNKEEKKAIIQDDLGRYLCFSNIKTDSVHKNEHKTYVIFHKECFELSITNDHATYDSLIKSGYNQILKRKDITSNCEWRTEITNTDSSQTYKDPYNGGLDTSLYYKATIKLSFYYPTKKKSDQFVFTGYIHKYGHKPILKADNTCDNKSCNNQGLYIYYFSDCDMYELHFPFPELYEYCTDIYNGDLTIYF